MQNQRQTIWSDLSSEFVFFSPYFSSCNLEEEAGEGFWPTAFEWHHLVFQHLKEIGEGDRTQETWRQEILADVNNDNDRKIVECCVKQSF